MDEQHVGLELLDALARPFITPAQSFPATLRARLVLWRIFGVHEMRRVRRDEAGDDATLSHGTLLTKAVDLSD
jgi:hypothetical protein